MGRIQRMGVLPESNKEKEGQAIRPKRVVEKLLPKPIHAVTAAGFELKLFLFLSTKNIKMRVEDWWQLRLI